MAERNPGVEGVKERLELLGPALKFFSGVTGLAATAFVEQNGQLRSFVGAGDGAVPCSLFWSDPELSTRCHESNLHHLRLAYQLGRHVIYECHAGMVDIVVPILGLGRLAGVFTGQVFMHPPGEREREQMVRRLVTAHTSAPRLRRALARSRFLPEERIEAAAQLLTDLTRYAMRLDSGSDLTPLRTYVASELLKRQEWRELRGIARLAGLEAQPRLVCAIQVLCPGWREAVDWEGLQRAREVAAKEAPEALGVIEGDKLVLLWGEAPGLEGRIRKLACALRSAGLRVAIGVGRPCGEERAVWQSYHEAEMALGYRYLTDAPVIFLEAMERQDQRSPMTPAGLQNLAALIRLGDRARAQEAARALIQELGRAGHPASRVLDGAVEILSLLLRELREAGNQSDALPGVLRNFVIRASRAANVQDMLALLEVSAMRLIGQVESTVSHTADLVERVCRLVEHHIAEPLTLERLCAEVLFVNPDHFSRVFRQAKGMRFKEYVQQRRVERARGLLASTKQSIAAVAARCGYNDAHYFCRVFRSATGVTPTQYRQAHASGDSAAPQRG